MSASVFKYMPSRYLSAFLDGSIPFRSLATFRGFEDQPAIGDQHEGKLLHRRPDGLEITRLRDGRRERLPGTFVSELRAADEVFVFCTTLVLSAELALAFDADVCVEITDVNAFSSRLRAAIAAESPSNVLTHGPVRYYEDADEPGVAWAIPDQVAMSKRAGFRSQHEYRFVFAERRHFELYGTAQTLVLREGAPTRRVLAGPPRFLEVGDIRTISRTHDPNAETAAAT